jgi:hypothetical protein
MVTMVLWNPMEFLARLRVPKRATSEADARRLWKEAERITGIVFSEIVRAPKAGPLRVVRGVENRFAVVPRTAG